MTESSPPRREAGDRAGPQVSRLMSERTKAHLLALHGAFTAALLATLGIWWAPLVVFAVQLITFAVSLRDDRRAFLAGDKHG